MGSGHERTSPASSMANLRRETGRACPMHKGSAVRMGHAASFAAVRVPALELPRTLLAVRAGEGKECGVRLLGRAYSAQGEEMQLQTTHHGENGEGPGHDPAVVHRVAQGVQLFSLLGQPGLQISNAGRQVRCCQRHA